MFTVGQHGRCKKCGAVGRKQLKDPGLVSFSVVLIEIKWNVRRLVNAI